MSIKMFQVDAFASGPFTGNPAAVCLMTEAATDQWLQSVAMEMNLSETAFVWKRGPGFHLRWFTPATEVELCGHATLAASHVLWEAGWASPGQAIEFDSLSGCLHSSQQEGKIYLDFPAKSISEVEEPVEIVESLGIKPLFCGKNDFDFFFEVATRSEVETCTPDFPRLGALTERGAIVMAGNEDGDCDFVSRFFGPACGINEDPVTGSAHVGLAPYWSSRLENNELTGYQASSRGGYVHTRVDGDRVHLGGTAVTIVQGQLTLAVE